MRLALALLLVAGCGGPPDELGARSFADTTVCPKVPQPVEGIDIAACQVADWPIVKQTRSFAIIKASEGDGKTWFYENPRFKGDWSGSKQAGVLRGAYHYFLPSKDGTDQANYFYSILSAAGGLQPGDLPPMLDWEDTQDNGDTTNPVIATPTIIQHAQQFLDRIQQLTGRTPLIYTYPWYWDSAIGHPSGFEKYPLNIANYGVNCPGVVPPWSDFMVWQWTSTGHPNGLSLNPQCKPDPNCPNADHFCVDEDRWNGSLSDLVAWTQGSAPLTQSNGNDALSVVNWSDGHVELFATTDKGSLFHIWTNGASNGWTMGGTLDSGAQCGFASSYWGPPWLYPEVFSPRPGDKTGHSWWANGQWNTFQDYGGAGMGLSHFSTLVWPDGRTEVFALGGDHAIWHDYWDTAKKDWSGWSSLGGDLSTGISTMYWPGSGGEHAELFATDSAGIVWHDWSGNYPGGWHGFDKLSGPPIASRPMPVRWPDGHGELFARGVDDQLYHSVAGANGFGAFQPLSSGTSIAGEPSVVYNPAGNGASEGPELFARLADGRVAHLWWSGKDYNSLTPLFDQQSASDPLAWTRRDGSAEVFVIDPAGSLFHTWHDPKNDWTPWAKLADNLDP
ncbi:MAG TPA: GH25 family lysozyme, partial [Polyangiaceae bacterium]|nr:GH25 family lysozyme [Polyangiaceae bacterium]